MSIIDPACFGSPHFGNRPVKLAGVSLAQPRFARPSLAKGHAGRMCRAGIAQWRFHSPAFPFPSLYGRSGSRPCPHGIMGAVGIESVSSRAYEAKAGTRKKEQYVFFLRAMPHGILYAYQDK